MAGVTGKATATTAKMAVIWRLGNTFWQLTEDPHSGEDQVIASQEGADWQPGAILLLHRRLGGARPGGWLASVACQNEAICQRRSHHSLSSAWTLVCEVQESRTFSSLKKYGLWTSSSS